MSDENDRRDLDTIMALLPEDVAYPCQIEVTVCDAQGRVISIEATPTEETHA